MAFAVQPKRGVSESHVSCFEMFDRQLSVAEVHEPASLPSWMDAAVVKPVGIVALLGLCRLPSAGRWAVPPPKTLPCFDLLELRSARISAVPSSSSTSSMRLFVFLGAALS